MTIKLDEDAWHAVLSHFVDARPAVYGHGVYCMERDSGGQHLRFASKRRLTHIDADFFQAVRDEFGPTVQVEQPYDNETHANIVVFDVRAPTAKQGAELRRRYDEFERMVVSSTWPTWVYWTIAAAMVLNILVAAKALHDHWHGHEEPTHTLFGFFSYHAFFYWAVFVGSSILFQVFVVVVVIALVFAGGKLARWCL